MAGVRDESASAVGLAETPAVVGDEEEEAIVEDGLVAWVVPSFKKTPRPSLQQV